VIPVKLICNVVQAATRPGNSRKLRTSENVDGEMREEGKAHQHIYTYLFSFSTTFTNVIIT
jgi:HKD family nuclease